MPKARLAITAVTVEKRPVAEVIDLILSLRKQLAEAGHDAGPEPSAGTWPSTTALTAQVVEGLDADAELRGER